VSCTPDHRPELKRTTFNFRNEITIVRIELSDEEDLTLVLFPGFGSPTRTTNLVSVTWEAEPHADPVSTVYTDVDIGGADITLEYEEDS
jgi:hypothetical protein